MASILGKEGRESGRPWPDYENSILGIPNAILSHFGGQPHHPTLAVLDERLRRGYRNVALLVLDGMGMNVLTAHAPTGFMANHCVGTLDSVYPCTTTSAMATFGTGLTPREHGWLGWSHFFAEIGKSVELFTHCESGTERPATNRNIVRETLGYRDLFSQINEADPRIACCRVSPFGEYRGNTMEAVCGHIQALCQQGGRRYIHAYHDQPDADIHRWGCRSDQAKAHIALFDRQLELLAASIADTLLIVTADHGLTDCTRLYVEDFPEIAACLAAPPTREPRSLSLFVKKEYAPSFPFIWKNHFGDSFVLMTGEAAFGGAYFGTGTPHPRARAFLGDYVALAAGNIGLWFRDEKGMGRDYKAMHAGLSTEEMTVPLILIP